MYNENLSSATRSALEELTLTLPVDLDNIMGEWNGDESGELEDRSAAAEEALELWNKLVETLEYL